MVKIPLIGFNPPHFCACPKPGPGFSKFNVGVLFIICVLYNKYKVFKKKTFSHRAIKTRGQNDTL
jgi:hypothetical protein